MTTREYRWVVHGEPVPEGYEPAKEKLSHHLDHARLYVRTDPTPVYVRCGGPRHPIELMVEGGTRPIGLDGDSPLRIALDLLRHYVARKV